MISLIVARARNGAIGRDNTIPWHVPEDLKFFQRETRGGVIIMGRNTWDSLPVKPLKNRVNMVVSSQGVDAEYVFGSVTAAVEAAYALGHRRIYGIGGAGIYREMLPIANRLLITEVDIDIPDADTFFPEIDTSDWAKIGSHTISETAPRCELVELIRKP